MGYSMYKPGVGAEWASTEGQRKIYESKGYHVYVAGEEKEPELPLEPELPAAPAAPELPLEPAAPEIPSAPEVKVADASAFEQLTKKELLEYAQFKFNVDLRDNDTKATLIEQIMELED